MLIWFVTVALTLLQLAAALERREYQRYINVKRSMRCADSVCTPFEQDEPCPPHLLCSDTDITDILLDNSDPPLTGSLSGVIGNFTKLTNLRLSNNGLTGTLPPSMRKLTQMRFLILHNNAFSGVFKGTNNMTALIALSIGHNKLSGTLPDFKPNTRLAFIYTENNYFTGELRGVPPHVADNSTACRVQNALDTNCLTGCPGPVCCDEERKAACRLALNTQTTRAPTLPKAPDVTATDTRVATSAVAEAPLVMGDDSQIVLIWIIVIAIVVVVFIIVALLVRHYASRLTSKSKPHSPNSNFLPISVGKQSECSTDYATVPSALSSHSSNSNATSARDGEDEAQQRPAKQRGYETVPPLEADYELEEYEMPVYDVAPPEVQLYSEPPQVRLYSAPPQAQIDRLLQDMHSPRDERAMQSQKNASSSDDSFVSFESAESSRERYCVAHIPAAKFLVVESSDDSSSSDSSQAMVVIPDHYE